MRPLALFVITLVSAYLSSVALAQPHGNTFISGCSAAVKKFDGGESSQYLQIGKCIGYIQGVVNSEIALQIHGRGNIASFCPPEDITNIQAVRIVEKYMRERPEELHMHEYIIVSSALKNAFPCKKSPG